MAVWLVGKFLLIERLEMWIISMKLQTLKWHSRGITKIFFFNKCRKKGLLDFRCVLFCSKIHLHVVTGIFVSKRNSQDNFWDDPYFSSIKNTCIIMKYSMMKVQCIWGQFSCNVWWFSLKNPFTSRVILHAK